MVRPWWFGFAGACAVLAVVNWLFAVHDTIGGVAAATWFVLPALALMVAVRRVRQPLLNPWAIITALVVYCWALRFTLAAFDSSDGIAYRTLVYGIEQTDLVRGLGLGLLGLLMLVAGYLAMSLWWRRYPWHPSSLARWHELDEPAVIDRGVLTALVLACLAVSFAGALLFFAANDFELIGGKRFNNVEGGAANRAGSLSYLFLRLSYLGHSAYVVLLALWLSHRGLSSRLLTWLIPVAGLLAVLGPLMANSRSGVGLVMIDTAMLTLILRRGHVKLAWFAAGAVALLAVLAWMLSIRQAEGRSLLSSLALILSGRDLFDLGKLGHISTLPAGVLNGQTLWGWLVFPVPESSLPFDKPMWTGLGQYVWSNSYIGGEGNGVPAGLFGELYLNVGVPGLIVGAAAFGALLAALYRTLLPAIEEHRVIGAVLFAVGIVRLVVFGLSNDLGTGVLSSLTDLIPILLILGVLLRLRTPARREPSVVDG